MAKCSTARHFFRLTSLQIGDLQSYLSDLSLFLAPDSKTFYVLVDNRPWLQDLVSRPAHLWQLMVTKSRMSPFAIRRARNDRKDTTQNFNELKFSSETSTSTPSENLRRWFLVIDAAILSRKRALLPVEKLRTSLLASSKLHRTLYGFIVFEVAWKDVRGINYLNELQTDTCLAIEAKHMRRWEFDSISQAAKGITSWFPGTPSECSLLKQQLNSMNVETDSQSDSCEEVDEATEYMDALLIFRFNDHDLPFELQDIIMPDLRLLTLLEAGLPSWVIFFQSYPVFCHIYRPWMCPLARFLYVAISIVTVVIGFYDLYKNIPLLKATASRLCGPLFGWIETWEMVSRIKYLGTMLFLHNSQKAVKWFLMMTCTLQSHVSFLTRPLMVVLEVLLPIWNIFIQTGDYFFSFVWILMTTFWNTFENLIDIILLPVYFIASIIWIIATAILYPVFWFVWGIVCAPVHLVVGVSNFVGFMFNHMYNLSGVIWIFVSGIFKVASNAETAASTYEVSMWRALWNDLFSQIFRAVRSILNGFVAFFTACNRHRLSIYNHVQELIRRLDQPITGRSRLLNSIQRVKKSGSKTLVESMDRRRGLVAKNIKQC
ncbi:hypothetical protein Lser_V15G24956 [Lactuca serriola]